MADEVVYRLIAGEGVTLNEESGTRTVTVSVPGLAQKINNGDIGLASTVTAGLMEIATDAEVQAMERDDLAVTPGGLGAAAQSSATDATAGRLLKVGAFGVGGAAIAATNLNDLDYFGAKLFWTPATLNAPTNNTYGYVEQHGVSGGIFQLAHDISSTREFFRYYNSAGVGGWSVWRELFHTGNFDPSTKASTSGTYPGLSVGNAAQLGGQTGVMLAPPGLIGDFAMPTAPAGWIKCNGAAVSRTTYSALFSAIGTYWGAGNGSTTFNLPEIRGLFRRSWDDSRGVDAGRAFASYQADEIISHSHGGGSDQGGASTLAPSGVIGSLAYTNTGATGGAETRPQNIAFLTCIKY